MPPPPFDRAAMLERLGTETFDVLVIGGGITGVGVALDAAGRGLRVALVDRGDFAAGTSSQSSKLVHGGLRYLQQGEFRLVYEALRERQRLLKNAPHLVRLLPFLIPVAGKGAVVDRKLGWALGKAMWLYDITGGARIGKLHRKITADEALQHFPTAAADKLAYAYVYYDATVDDARLVVNVARTAASKGAAVANYCAVQAIEGSGGDFRVTVLAEIDGDTRREFPIKARAVVNATGVWSDSVRTMAEKVDPDAIRPAKGIHITVPWEKVRNDIALVVPVPEDKRSMFVVPWLPKPDGTFTFTYIGTTDTSYAGSVDEPQCTPEDVAYVLRALNASLTTSVQLTDVVGAWVGLRPLVKASKAAPSGRTADMSRRHKISDIDGVVSVSGGKLTTYREMAEDAVDVVCRRLGRKELKTQSAETTLLGADGFVRPDDHSEESHLACRYGSETSLVTELLKANPDLGRPAIDGLPYLRAEVVHACRHEMAFHLDDVLTRRTRARLQLRDASEAAASSVAALMATELGWSDRRQQEEIDRYLASVARERDASGIPVVSRG